MQIVVMMLGNFLGSVERQNLESRRRSDARAWHFSCSDGGHEGGTRAFLRLRARLACG